jgi:hypothetical protein
MAMFVGKAVSDLQRRYDDEQENREQGESRKGKDRFSRAKARRAEIELEIGRATDELRNWYLLLIEASNLVFQVEYWARRSEAWRALK